MASYATIAQLKAWLSAGTDSDVTFTADDTLTLQQLLDAATAFIERYTGRLFRAEVAVAKEFYAPSNYHLDLPDIRTITGLTYDSTGQGTFNTTLVEGTDYYKSPLVPFPDAGIYTGVRVYPYSSRGFWGQYRARVTGDWGYVVGSPLAAPPPIQQACLMEATRLWARKGAPLGIIVNANIGTFTRLTAGDGDVKALLDQYRSATDAPNWIAV